MLCVSIIDTEGKTVNGIRAYNDGYAVFMTEDFLFGAIDVDGNCVVKPVYCSLNNAGDDKFIGMNVKYKEHVKKGNKDYRLR